MEHHLAKVGAAGSNPVSRFFDFLTEIIIDSKDPQVLDLEPAGFVVCKLFAYTEGRHERTNGYPAD